MYKVIFTLDCVKDYIDIIDDFDNIQEIMRDGGFDFVRNDETYEIIYEDNESYNIETIWDWAIDELEVALNNSYYKRTKDKTVQIFKEYGLSDLEITAKEHELYVGRYEFEEFYEFDFESEDEMTIDGAKAIAIKKNE